MTHGEDLVESLPDDGAHPKCLQTAFSEKAGRPAKKFRSIAKKGREPEVESVEESRKRGCVKRQGRETRGLFWVQRHVHGGELEIFVRGGGPG